MITVSLPNMVSTLMMSFLKFLFPIVFKFIVKNIMYLLVIEKECNTLPLIRIVAHHVGCNLF